MQNSKSIKELAGALAKAQGEIMGAHKDSANPYFNSRYADLASVWDACRIPLSKNGLSVVQTCRFEDGHVNVETMLMHESGEWIADVLAMTPVKTDPQGIGSCLTYARRYSLAAIAGVCPEDDDAEAAVRGKASPTTKKSSQRDPSAGFDPTWREVHIHFGKHAGTKLGEIEAKSVHWYYAEWMPKKKTDAKYPPKNDDKLLFAALESWHAEIEEKKASEEKPKAPAEPAEPTAEPPVIEVEDWRKIVCHVGKINGAVHGKKLGDLYPANLDSLKENFKPAPGKGGAWDPFDAMLYWAIRAAIKEMDASANAGASAGEGGAK